jgi:hypothetical protein
MATRRTNPNIYRENNVPSSKPPQQLEERKEKGLCFNYKNKYNKGHNEFQVMIANGGTINCLGKFHKINLTMGEYVINSPMISIPMGGVDVVIGVEWLQSLGIVAFNFQELFMKFSLEEKEFELRGITWKPITVVSSNDMTK